MKAGMSVFCQSFLRFFSHLSPLKARLLYPCAAILLCNCAQLNGNQSTSLDSSQHAYLTTGILTIMRPAPAVAPIQPATLLGLLPGSVPALTNPSTETTVVHSGPWLSVDRKRNALILMNNAEVIYNFKCEGLSHISPGSYALLHKQRNPLWYATDSYFKARSINIPPTGDKERFLRGALGNFVIYLNKDTPIHSGPIWVDEIGGARMDESDLSRIYYNLEIGAPVEVQ